MLAGSTAFAAAGALGEPYGLEQKPKQAKLFYGVLVFASIAGIALNFTRINPIRALYWSAVINGVAAVPSMVMIMKMSTNPKVMGAFTISTSLKVWGWLATAVMAAAAVVMFVTWGK